MSSSEIHPGYYIRENVLPKGMSVTNAAKLLGVGRPALSNLLNGNASLSPDMAARLEKTFGINARKLMDMQAAYDTALAMESGAAESSQPYVPVFLQFKANDIEDWAGSISARSRLAVFLERSFTQRIRRSYLRIFLAMMIVSVLDGMVSSKLMPELLGCRWESPVGNSALLAISRGRPIATTKRI